MAQADLTIDQIAAHSSDFNLNQRDANLSGYVSVDSAAINTRTPILQARRFTRVQMLVLIAPVATWEHRVTYCFACLTASRTKSFGAEAG